MTERAEHVSWCKKRAHEYLRENDLSNAVASMISDMNKREDCRVNEFLAMAGMLSVANYDNDGVRRFIDGFN